MVRDSALAIQINVLLGQFGNAALGGAFAREVCPDHAGHRVLRGIAAMVGHFDVVALAVEDQRLLALIVDAEFRLAVDICVVAVP